MAYRGLGQTEEARKSSLAAISIVEQLRTQVAGGEEQQQGFLSMRLDPYYGMVELLNAQKQPAEALKYARNSQRGGRYWTFFETAEYRSRRR